MQISQGNREHGEYKGLKDWDDWTRQEQYREVGLGDTQGLGHVAWALLLFWRQQKSVGKFYQGLEQG